MMKPKNANIVQLHLEKIVLGVAVLAAVLIAFMYVVGNPWAVSVGNVARAPAEVPRYVHEEAQRLQADLSQPTTQLPNQKVPPYSQAFKDRARQVPVDSTRMIAMGETGLDRSYVDVGDLPPYDVPRPPVASNLRVATGHAVLAPTGNVNTDRQLVQMAHVSDRGPADFPYVTVGAEFDMKQWEQRLLQASNNPIPGGWWRSSMFVSGVFLQRQELVDPLREEWSEPMIVAQLPTQSAFSPDAAPEYTPEQADQDAAFIRQNQETIARVPFVPIGPQTAYRDPFQKRMTTEERASFAKIQDDIRATEKRIQMLQDNLAKQQEIDQRRLQRDQRTTPRTRTRTPTYEPPGGGYDDMPPGYDGGFAPPTQIRRPGASASRAEEIQFQISEQMARLQDLNRQLYDLVGEEMAKQLTGQATGRPGQVPMPGGYEQYGPPPSGVSPEEWYYMNQGDYGDPYGGIDPYTGQPIGPNMATPVQPGVQQPEQSTVKVWAHDLTVEPGKTYRYRVVVTVMNPLFRQSRVAPQQRARNYNKIALAPAEEELAAAPWSDPVTVDKQMYFFVISADEARQRATVEVWRVYDGSWRSAEFTVEPGDIIGATTTINTTAGEVPLDMTVGAVALDMISTSGGGAGASTRFLFVEPGTEALESRLVDEDRSSNVRIRLQTESNLARQLAGTAQFSARQ